MFRLTTLISAMALMFFSTARCQSDSASVDSLIIGQLPLLDSLVGAALRNAPVIQLCAAEIARNEAEVKVRKREWSNRVFTDAGGSYANNYSVLTVASDGGGFESVALGSGNVVRAGITARLSLFDLIGRNQLVKRAEAERQMSESQLLQARQDVTSIVTQLYTELKLAQRLVTINTQTVQTLRAQIEMAEKEFRQGEIHITELARITEIKSKSEAALATAQSNYENLYRQMEIIVGTSLSNLL